jgi:hypothetical protein
MKPRVAKTLAYDLAADPILCDVFANLHLHRKREMDLERAVEIMELRFSEF